MKFKLIIILLLILLFTNCLSIYFTENKSNSYILVTKIDFEDQTNGNFSPFVHIRFTTIKDGKELSFEIGATSPYSFDRFLPPGIYNNWKIQIINEARGARSKEFKYDIPLKIEKNCITLFPYKFQFNLFIGTSGYYMTIDNKIITLDEVELIVNSFKKDKNFYTYKSLIFGDKVIIDDIKKIEINEQK